MSRLLRAWRAIGGRLAPSPSLPVRPLQFPEIVDASSGSRQIAVGESLGWLNALFDGLWPRVNAAAQRIVHEELTREIQSHLPAMLRKTHFNEFTLGVVPPRLGPIKVYETGRSLKVTLGIDYRSDVDISLQVGPLSVGVRELSINGELVVRMEQLIDQLPVVGGIVIYFLNPPRVDFSLTGLGIAAEFPGVSGLIRRAIDKSINNSLVLPNQVAIPLGTESQGVDRAELMHAKPLGILRVTATSATNLQAPDWAHVDKDVADAYVVVRTADERWESSTVEATSEPVWPEDEYGDLFIYDRDQRIWATVFDHDHSETCDFVGATKDISISEALDLQEELTLYAKEHVGQEEEVDEAEIRGKLSLGFRFLEFVPGELCGDKIVLCVKVHAISLPPEFGGTAQLIAKLETGSSKATPVAKEVVEYAGSVVVSDLLRDVIKRADAKGLAIEDIAEITGLDADDVASVVGGGEVTEEAVISKTRRIIHVDSCLFMPFSAETLDSESVEVTIADKKGTPLASKSFSMIDLAEAEDLTIAELHTMPSASGEEVEAHVSLTLMGSRESLSE
eukprot:TRINITY_DN61111_c0_g1_i1.p1 TRINITY_DN61111_c0_g1~~TRINITY_DN61111_c0_g1_i1.p1  ORF type:complete len:564 (-),score=84.44 TRINITY_DN61111_c0_g1_i1:41-1732(-)